MNLVAGRERGVDEDIINSRKHNNVSLAYVPPPKSRKMYGSRTTVQQYYVLGVCNAACIQIKQITYE